MIQSLIYINGPFVLNNYVRFATIQRIPQPSIRSLFYPWRGVRWMLMCTHRISSDTPFHLSSAWHFLGLQIGIQCDSIIFMLLCVCAPLPFLSNSCSTSHSVCLEFSAFSVCANSAFASLMGWHFGRRWYCETFPWSSGDVTAETNFLPLCWIM